MIEIDNQKLYYILVALVQIISSQHQKLKQCGQDLYVRWFGTSYGSQLSSCAPEEQIGRVDTHQWSASREPGVIALNNPGGQYSSMCYGHHL
jgi:hypothetical protein